MAPSEKTLPKAPEGSQLKMENTAAISEVSLDTMVRKKMKDEWWKEGKGIARLVELAS